MGEIGDGDGDGEGSGGVGEIGVGDAGVGIVDPQTHSEGGQNGGLAWQFSWHHASFTVGEIEWQCVS